MCGKRRKIINHVLILDFGTFVSQKSQNNWKGKIEEGVKRGGKRFICFFFFLFSFHRAGQLYCVYLVD